ncbi:MAG: EamA family transporter [Nitriliruptorales bacterium]
MAIALALASAVGFGVADFLGGVATRRSHTLPITGLSQAVGAVLLVVAVPLVGGNVTSDALVWGGIAGIGGAGGLALYLRALAIGPMGVTGPLAAVAGAMVPVVVGLAMGERPGLLASIGVAAGVLAAALVSRPAPSAVRTSSPWRTATSRGVLAALGAGLLFGLFFVALERAPTDSGLWPLVGARATGLTLILALLASRRPALPSRVAAGTGLVSGALDMAANVLFLLAVRQGLLVLTAVLTSLYPVIVLLLARQVLGERLSRTQWGGVATALTAVALIAV